MDSLTVAYVVTLGYCLIILVLQYQEQSFPKMIPLCWEERTSLHVCFLHLTNTSNYLKDGHVLEFSFCSQDSKCAPALNVRVLIDANFMFVVTPATFVFLSQSQKKVVSPNTEALHSLLQKQTVERSNSSPLWRFTTDCFLCPNPTKGGGPSWISVP